MAINNINTLIDQTQLENLVEKYYNEALANLGQRNIDDKQLKFVSYTIDELVTDVKTFVSNNEEISFPLLGKYLILKNKYNTNEIIFTNDAGTSYKDYFNISNSNTTKAVILRAQIKILTNLFIKLVNEIEGRIDDNISGLTQTYTLYFPKDYIFEYISDGVNESNIFGSARDIYVSIVPSSFTDVELDKIQTPFILNNQSYVKTEIYNYVFKLTDDFNYDVICNLEYVLPFIKDDVWYINDVNTEIQAKSKDAMNLNLVLAESNINEGKLNILSGFNNSIYQLPEVNLVGTLESDYKVWCRIKDVNNKSDIIFNIMVYLPNIDLNAEEISIHIDSLSDNDELLGKKILANSTLIILSKVSDCVIESNEKRDTIINQLGSNGYITTIWQYNIENQRFEYISIDTDNDKNQIALDLSTMSNITNLIGSSLSNYEQLPPDNYLFTQLVFDAAEASIKHSTKETKKGNHPAFQNLQGSDYSKYYQNNLNFILKYINNIKYEGDVITDIGNDSFEKYLRFDNTTNSVTNKLYSNTDSDNIVHFYNDWLPNYNVPLFDLSEVLIKDSNVLNRQNILTFDAEGQIYYSYIGSSFDINYQDKNILHIGSSNTNINLGNDTMLAAFNTDKFKKQTSISIDFDNIDLNGTVNIKNDLNIDKNIYFNKESWTLLTDVNGNNKTKITSIIPRYKYIPNNSNSNVASFHILEINNLLRDINNLLTEKIEGNLSVLNKDYLYANIILKYTINSNNYYYKHGDLLYIPNLLRYLDLSLNTIIVSTTNEIIYKDNKAIFLCSNNNELSKFINLSADAINSDLDINVNFNNDAENINYTAISSTNIFVGNALDLVYFENNNTLLVNERKSNKIQSIWKLPTQL